MDLESKKKWKFLTSAAALSVALLGISPTIAQTSEPRLASQNSNDAKSLPDFLIAPSSSAQTTGASPSQHASHESHASHASHASHSSHTSSSG